MPTKRKKKVIQPKNKGVMRVCPQCTTKFEIKRINQFFCSKTCKLEFAKPNHACPDCGSIHRIRRPDSPGLQYEKAPN